MRNGGSTRQGIVGGVEEAEDVSYLDIPTVLFELRHSILEDGRCL